MSPLKDAARTGITLALHASLIHGRYKALKDLHKNNMAGRVI